MGTGCSINHSGDPEVGKTCVMLRYLKNQFSPMYIPTKKAVIESAVKKVNVPGHVVVSLTLWDIPGREDIDLHKTYFRNLDAAVVVVDMTDINSIEMAPVWKQTVLSNTVITHPVNESSNSGNIQTRTMEETPVDPDTFPVLLLGNKFDVIEQRIQEKERLIWSIDGPMKEEEKPECVKKLEKVASDNNFHGSMMASSRDGDGSVKDALQYLIRHLLESKYAVKKWKLREQKEKKKRNKIIEYGGLDMIDVQQAQILKSGENSLEDCIMALKRSVGENAEMKVKKDEEFCKLDVVSKDENFKLPKNIKSLLKVFHNEFAAVCKAIMNECPNINKKLQELDEKIAEMCNECWDLVATRPDGIPRTKDELNQISSTIEQNRAKMQHALLESRAAVDIIEDSKVKIKAAFL
ncbi:hypothetical protein KUTeg_006737, partial [Tegillarca granosa]